MTVANRRFLLLFVALAALAFCIVMFRLDAVPLRGDEAYNIMNWTYEPFSANWWNVVQREPHPIGGFLLYIGWIGAVGDSVFAARMLSVLSHIFGLAVCIATARKLTQGTPKWCCQSRRWLGCSGS